MYFRREKDDGSIEFLPFYDGCVYMHCTHCGRYLPIFNLTDFLADSGAGDDVTFYSDMCEECIGEEDLRYEEYMKKYHEDSRK